MMKREIQAQSFDQNNKELTRLSIHYGIRLFFNYITMLFYLISFLGSLKD
ncbi:hypothetical protein [Mycoplasma crocodyli]|nr:hypothetical protein [Mycoplasma crocodyli]